MPRIAIQPDRTLHGSGESQSYSERWMELCLSRGWQADFVNAWSSEFPALLRGYDAFMWRPGPLHRQRALMKDIALLQELYTDILVYPSSKTMMTASKLDQAYLAQILSIPMPATKVFRSKPEALGFIETAQFPMVLKLDMGNTGRNVAKVLNKKDARQMVELMFGSHVDSIRSNNGILIRQPFIFRFFKTRIVPAAKLLLGYQLDQIFWSQRLESDYFYVQEFLPGNSYDTRVWVMGHRAFAMRRFNRENDFRASGSELRDWNPESIDPEIIRLAFKIAADMGTQSNAMDFAYKNGEPVLLESNLSFASWAVRDCPGHWTLTESGDLEWHAGMFRAEDAIFEVFENELLATL